MICKELYNNIRNIKSSLDHGVVWGVLHPQPRNEGTLTPIVLAGTNATLQSLPALLSLFQQSSNVNKVLGLLSKMPLQIGGKEGDEMLQYLNINFANMMTPPNTPNMFNFPEYIVPAAQAINQVHTRSIN